ncbi:hypothetical protein PsorP6_007476 [Peronosclerospora sorghi]|uniref:Uncharacterized protein n=1 Tax=Peronosclerospora sorghi TaxID=230839 RepID=A0ACC0W9D1_9STRA|nr:hypothetical protein PsorP6_007476 [Peronosclerospora sorghi]
MMNEWMLDTDGTNILDVMCYPQVDSTRTILNDIVEIIQVLGIEAVRRALLNEIRQVISFNGAYVNYRYLACLCHVMTFRGHLMAITRHGINRDDSGPLVLCSFEKTVEILMDAAMFSEGDPLTGVSENVMLGQLAPLGTGIMDFRNGRLSIEAQENATLFFQLLLRSTLASKCVTLEHRLTETEFESHMGEIESKFTSALVSAGEMTVVVGAQSIGEPATQKTLNTFHYAGMSAKNVTLGAPRLKEIMNIAKDVRTPSLRIFLTPDCAHDADKAKFIESQLEYTTLADMIANTSIYYDPDPMNTVVEEDQEFNTKIKNVGSCEC